MTEHYFSEAPTGDTRRREISVRLAGAERRLVTSGGVFSPEHLDQGTAVLLAWLDREPEDPARSGPILDLGCGWGPIAIQAALAHPDRDVWAVDRNARARDLTAENAARLGLERVLVAAPDDVPEELTFAAIHSNPPIRIGKAALHDLLRRWLPRVAPGGRAALVVAKHLGAESLQRWIAAEFPDFDVARAARDRGFHVLTAARPDTAR